MTVHYFPLAIESTKKQIKLTDSIHLLRFDLPHVRRLIGIQDVALSSNGSLSAISYGANTTWPMWSTYLRDNNPSHKIWVQLSNFVLATATQDQAILVAFAMKLLASSLSGPFVGFSADGKSVQFLRFRPWWGKHFLKLEHAEICLLRKLLAALLHFPDKRKLTTIVELFRYAESADVPSPSQRFLQLAIILELLFLPKKTSELSYRFQLRVAKWFHRFYKDDLREVADQAANIYRIRSTIAHEGVGRVSDHDMSCVRDLTRRALQQFVVDPMIFSDSSLNDLCLLGK